MHFPRLTLKAPLLGLALLAPSLVPANEFDESAEWSYDLPPGWTAFDSAQWQTLVDEDDNWTLVANRHADPASSAAVTLRRPREVCWLPTLEWRSFVFTAEVQLLTDHPNRDADILFAGQSPTHFVYAHVSAGVDGNHHQIQRVADADREPVTSRRDEAGVPFVANEWTSLRLEVDAEAGTVRVFVDGSEEATLEAEGLDLDWGRIGLGSFDDLTA